MATEIVVAILGAKPIEPKPGQELNIENALCQLGWQKIPE